MDFVIGYAGLFILILLGLMINRHIIGGAGYNFFPPLVIGYAIHTFTLSYSWIFIVIVSTLLGWLSTKLITNYINLSLYPRYGLYAIMSLSIFITSGILYTGYVAQLLSMEDSQTLISFFVILLAMAIKTYSGGKGLISPIRWGHVVRFFCISFAISVILDWTYGYTYFMYHGFSVIVLAFCTLLIGAYTGLQVKEMIRFRKLIWTKITNRKKRG